MTTSTSTKITNRTALEYAIRVINNDDSWCDKYDPDEVINKLESMIDALDKRASTPRKPTKTQLENEELKGAIFSYLTEEREPRTIKSITESLEVLDGLSNQRVTHLLTALRNEGKVKRTVVKKVPFYEIGTEEKEEG